MSDSKCVKLSVEGTLELPVVVRTDGSDLSPGEGRMLSDKALQKGCRAVHVFHARVHLGTDNSPR